MKKRPTHTHPSPLIVLNSRVIVRNIDTFFTPTRRITDRSLNTPNNSWRRARLSPTTTARPSGCCCWVASTQFAILTVCRPSTFCVALALRIGLAETVGYGWCGVINAGFSGFLRCVVVVVIAAVVAVTRYAKVLPVVPVSATFLALLGQLA